MTLYRMFACEAPHSCEQLPWYTPARSVSTSQTFFTVGMAARWPPMLGAQKPWITSPLVRVMATFWRVGMIISLPLVTTPPPCTVAAG